MIAIDSTITFQIIFFLFLWFILNKLLFGPFLRLLEERERRTEGVKSETAALEDEGVRLRAEYEAAIAKAREAGSDLKEALVQEGRREREQLLSRAREESTGLLERVRQEVQNELRRERELAAREAQAVAQDIVGKILGRRIG